MLRKEFAVPDTNLFNMDETPVFYDMPASKSITDKSEKRVYVTTTNSEKRRITVTLCCNAAGEKLPLLVMELWVEKVIVPYRNPNHHSILVMDNFAGHKDKRNDPRLLRHFS